MPRPLRFVLPGHTLHIIQRGNNRFACFRDDRDRERYLAVLRDASQRARCTIHAYVLMTNHSHLLVSADEARSPARMMHSLGGKYARYFNTRHGRTGTMWEGRYRASLIDSERYFLVCSRYIESNPVRAGIVREPAGYRWSSYRCNAEGEIDVLVREHPVYLSLGRDQAERRETYRALFAAPIASTMLDAIRRATNSNVRLVVDGHSPPIRRPGASSVSVPS